MNNFLKSVFFISAFRVIQDVLLKRDVMFRVTSETVLNRDSAHLEMKVSSLRSTRNADSRIFFESFRNVARNKPVFLKSFGIKETAVSTSFNRAARNTSHSLPPSSIDPCYHRTDESSSRHTWNLVLGTSLVIGAWSLELRSTARALRIITLQTTHEVRICQVH